MFKKLLCYFKDHDWNQYGFGKRYCNRCDKYQVLFEHRFPKIGEPKYTWNDMGNFHG